MPDDARPTKEDLQKLWRHGWNTACECGEYDVNLLLEAAKLNLRRANVEDRELHRAYMGAYTDALNVLRAPRENGCGAVKMPEGSQETP
jgi:hypothetical protein